MLHKCVDYRRIKGKAEFLLHVVDGEKTGNRALIEPDITVVRHRSHLATGHRPAIGDHSGTIINATDVVAKSRVAYKINARSTAQDLLALKFIRNRGKIDLSQCDEAESLPQLHSISASGVVCCRTACGRSRIRCLSKWRCSRSSRGWCRWLHKGRHAAIAHNLLADLGEDHLNCLEFFHLVDIPLRLRPGGAMRAVTERMDFPTTVALLLALDGCEGNLVVPPIVVLPLLLLLLALSSSMFLLLLPGAAPGVGLQSVMHLADVGWPIHILGRIAGDGAFDQGTILGLVGAHVVEIGFDLFPYRFFDLLALL